MLLSSTLALISDATQRYPIRSLSLDATNRRLIRTSSSSKIFFCLSALPLLFLKGFRYGIGIDYFYTYVPGFEKATIGEKTNFELLFDIWIRLFANIIPDYKIFFFFDALVFITLIWIAIYISGVKAFLPVLIFSGGYDFIRSFCFERQYLAMALCLFAIVLLLFTSHKYIASFFLICAGFIHTSAFLMLITLLLAYIVRYIRGKGTVYITILIGLCSVIPMKFLLSYFFLNSRYKVYQDTSFVEDAKFGWALLLINVCIFLIMLFCFRTSTKRYNSSHLVFLYLQLAAVIFSLLQGSVPLVYRLVWYFAFPQVISVPLFLSLYPEPKGSKGVTKLIITFIIISAYLFVCFGYYMPQDSIDVLPYMSIFDIQ
jgi:hypothetical protein